MNISKWQVILIVTAVIVSAGLAGGCMLTASPETADTTSSSAAAAMPSDETLIGSDPASGRNQEIDLRWQEFCLSSEYQVQIAKDPRFSIIVVDTGTFDTAVYYPAGGLARSPPALTPWANLESGHTYYWRARVRQAATGQYMRSPWSEVQSFTVGSGLPVSTPFYGPQPVYPNNGGIGCPVKPASFTWSPFNDTIKYRFVLAKDAAMTQVVKEAEVTTTAYEYDGQLEYGQSYFWKVMALEPAPGDWSAIFSFQTEAAPTTSPPQPELQKDRPQTTPLWAWVIIAIGLALLIPIIVLIFRARRR
jgi:hypothetical protein